MQLTKLSGAQMNRMAEHAAEHCDDEYYSMLIDKFKANDGLRPVTHNVKTPGK